MASTVIKKVLSVLSVLSGCLLFAFPVVSVAVVDDGVFVNAEFSALTMASEGDSAAPFALFLHVGKKLTNNIVLEGYYATGLTEEVLTEEQIGLDTSRTNIKLASAIGMQARFLQKISEDNHVFLLLGFGKTSVDVTFEDCIGGFSVVCTEDGLAVSETGVNYGAGISLGSFTITYNMLFSGNVEDLGADAEITGINLGYLTRF